MADPADTRDWRNVALAPGILRESADSRLVLWAPAERDHGYQYWQRVGTVARAKITHREGLCAIAVVATRVRQRVRRRFDSVLRCFRRIREDRDWLLPNGETGEKCGERQTNLLLVWSADHSQPVDTARIRAHWPGSTPVQSLGPNLFLVNSVADAAAAEPLSGGSAWEQVEQLLDRARESGNRTAEIAALTDLGVLYLEQEDLARTISHLEEALILARGDEDREGDILCNLGFAKLKVNQPQQARQHLERALILARAASDRFAEKLVLERLAAVQVSLGNVPVAVGLLAEALSLARTLGDRVQESILLWLLAVLSADLGIREQALDYGQAAVSLLEKLGKPQAGVYREHLQRYRRDDSEARAREGAGQLADGPTATTAMLGHSGPVPAPKRTGPSYLQMAMSAGAALVRYVGSGLKTVNAETLQGRLRQCTACEHHTGVRCRVCGCITGVKARLPLEDCPLGKWSSLPERTNQMPTSTTG